MRVLVVGECLVDVVHRPDGSVVERPGGSPANVAVGLGRLGLEVTLLTSYDDDARGRALQAHLSASSVRTVVVPGPTSVAVGHLDDDGRASWEIDLHWALGDVDLPAPDLLHVGSVAATTGDDVLRLVDRWAGDVLVSYDPNCRPQVMGPAEGVRDRVEELAALADVVKLSDEDCAWLHPDRPVADVAAAWLDAGPQLVVVTSGPRGADGWTAAGHLHVDAPAGDPVVDTVGAGDAFTAGLLWGLVEHHPSPLETASRVARLSCSRAGADLPWRDEL